jgi:hypothetical protein
MLPDPGSRIKGSAARVDGCRPGKQWRVQTLLKLEDGRDLW